MNKYKIKFNKIKIRKMINNNKNYNIYTFNIPIIQYNYINYFT